MWTWLLHVLGVDSVSGPWYAFWSGVAGDVSSVVIIGGAVNMFIRHNCQVKGCHRVGRFTVPNENGGYTVCAKHHPAGAPRAADLKGETSEW